MSSEQQGYSSDELPLSQDTFQHVWNDLKTSSDGGLYTQIMNTNLETSESDNGGSTSAENRQYNITENITTYVDPQNWMTNPSHTIPQNLDNLLELDVQTLMYNSSDQNLTVSQAVVTNQPQTALPAMCNWKGDYGFDIMFEPQDVPSKGIAWTYSEIKDKLYVMKSVPCPVKFFTNPVPEDGVVIRAGAVFIHPNHVHEVVKRCINHARSPDPANTDHPAPDHLIRCESPYATYVTDPVTGRHSVVVPYEKPHAGADYTSYIYKYMCWGSCVGGLNRRRVNVIFTLEKDGQCLGRRVLEIRICACPGRDRRSDEKNYIAKQSLNQPLTQNEKAFNEARDEKEKQDDKEVTNILNGLSRKRKSTENNEVYILKVSNRKTYELLKKIKNAIELADRITPDLLNLIERRRGKKQKLRSSEDESE